MAVIVVPTLTALVLGGLRAQVDLEHAAALRHTADQVRVAQSVTSLVHELQQERTLAVAWVASGKTRPRTELDTQIGIVDEKVAAARKATENLETDDKAAMRRYDAGVQRLSVLDDIRTTLQRTAYPDVAVYTAYSGVLDAIVRLGREVNVALTDRNLLNEGTVVQALSVAKENVAKENAILQIAAARKEFPGDTLSRIRAAEASAAGAIANYRANASTDQLQLYSDTVSGPRVDQRERIMARAVAVAESAADKKNRGDGGGKNDKVAIDRNELTTAGADTLGHLREVEDDLLGAMRGNAGDLAASATRSAVQDAVIVLGALIIALALVAVVTLSLLKPMRMLRREALEVAHRRLPSTVKRILAEPDPAEAAKQGVEPIAVTTREETGQVARAFDVVQEQAVLMATEQALLRDNINSIFVNLSRRSQALVERQLSLIDGLELDEQDPEQLASLFELDHLATRMRRYSESLLVLSGAGLSRQFSRPVPASEVVGAAVSEVEQYSRIQVAAGPDVAVQGRVVSDLVHLLAELLDNATFFSEPDKPVNVRMTVTRNEELGIQITDQGVGMPQDAIDVANERLADPPDLDVAVTRRMGLYVVARLANRHGIQVRLRESEDISGGLIARIIVPSALVQPLDRSGGQPAPTAGFRGSENGRPAAPASVLEPVTELPRVGQNGTDVAAFTPFGPAAEPSTAEQNGSGDYYSPPAGEETAPVATGTDEEHLPIFEAVSRWFSTDQVDGSAPAGDGAAAADAPAAEQELPAWASPGDEGWLAAGALADNGAQETTTSAGLPKRVPKAYLVPGSARAPAAQPTVGAGPAPQTPRSADAVRGRMSSLQDGVRRGRHVAAEAHAETKTGPEKSRQDEEQE